MKQWPRGWGNCGISEAKLISVLTRSCLCYVLGTSLTSSVIKLECRVLLKREGRVLLRLEARSPRDSSIAKEGPSPAVTCISDHWACSA